MSKSSHGINTELLKAFASLEFPVLKETPFTIGLGCSLRIEYPPKIVQKIEAHGHKKPFAFFALNIHDDKFTSESDSSEVTLTIQAAEPADPIFDENNISTLQSSDHSIPLRIEEPGYLRFEKGHWLFKKKDAEEEQSLDEVVTEFWHMHVNSFWSHTGFFIRFQKFAASKYQRRYLFSILLTETIVRVFSGCQFESKHDSKSIDSSITRDLLFSELDESFSKWLERVTPFLELTSEETGQNVTISEKISEEKISFQGLHVKPIAVFWFYAFIVLFYFYKYSKTRVGEVTFIDAYSNAILFLAPFFFLIVSWALPAIGKFVILRDFNMHLKLYDAERFITEVRKSPLGFYYLKKKNLK